MKTGLRQKSALPIFTWLPSSEIQAAPPAVGISNFHQKCGIEWRAKYQI